MSGVASHIRLVNALAEYERTEHLAGLFPNVPALGQQADRLHQQMLKIALACGFAPGREHSHLSTLEWSRQRVEVLKRTFPHHVAEVRQDNHRRAA